MEKPDVLKEKAFQKCSGIKDTTLAYMVALPILQAQRDDTYMRTRQDTAREIFEAIKRAYRHKDQHYMADGMIDREFRCVSEHSIEALESKYLIPPNPVGNAEL